MKAFFKNAAIFAALAGVVWVGGWLYRHVRLVGALSTMEGQAAPAQPGSSIPYSVPPEAHADVREAGCRALPYLVERLDPGKNPAFLAAASQLILDGVKQCRASRAYEGSARVEPMYEWRLLFEDSPAERTRKCEAMRGWWRTEGGRHQGWKWWASSCR